MKNPTPPPAPRRARFGLPVRFKLLATFSVVLLAAIGTYLSLATTLFARDKLAYVYDANLALADGVAAQTQSSLQLLARMLQLTGRDVSRLSEAEREAAVRELFSIERDLLSVEVYERVDGSFERTDRFLHEALALEMAIRADDLDLSRQEHPLPVDAIAHVPGKLFIQNGSLPPDGVLLTVAVAQQTQGGVMILAADFRPDRLLRIMASSKMHATWMVDERGGLVMHADPARIVERGDWSSHPLVRAGLEERPDRGVKTFQRADGEEMLGAWARIPTGRLLVVTEIPREVALSASRQLVARSTLFAAAVLLMALIASIYLSRRLTDPIRRLRSAAEQIGLGRFDVPVEVHSRDELGELAESFNHMAQALKSAQIQLVRSEKMAVFGQLGAGITHEVKNPIAGIVGLAQVAQHSVDRPEKLKELLKMIETEGLRCTDILVNFLRFARQEPGARAMEPVSVNEAVSAAVKVFSHQLAATEVYVELHLDPSAPKVLGVSGELQQVLLNLAINAQQAMKGGGKVTIETRRDGDWAELRFTDDGPGIPEELRERIFDPFFTTKAPGEGTGLGLAVSYGIIRDHQGTITVESQVGQGTSFRIRLPLLGASGDREVARAS